MTTAEHTAYLKIAEGCDNLCTYCAIPLIRGRFRSRSIEDIVKEAKELESLGVKELNLIDQDTTRYGLDIYGEYSLARLVREICAATDIPWIRLLYCYPDKITDELIDELATNPRLLKYMDIPIQHISDSVLKRMNRHGGTALIKETVKKLRERVPGIVLRTTAMVGFPGESEEDFAELMEFVKATKFDRLGVFPYSEEEGTYSATRLKDDVPEEVKQERVERIMRLQERVSLENNARRIGQTMRVIVDRKEGDFYIGRSEYDSPEVDQELIIESFGKRLLRGRFYDVKITDCEDYDLYAEII